MITISDKAQLYLLKLLTKERESNPRADIEIRIEIIDEKTPFAECGIRFFKPGPEHQQDTIIGFSGFKLFVEYKSIQSLQDTTIDLEKQGIAEELVMNTPNLTPLNYANNDDAPLFDRIVFVLETEINPELAMHGGMVRLVDINAENDVILQFGGGCQGCGMIDVTLKQGIEKSLKQRFPEIGKVVDATDHASGEKPYYQNEENE